jgi:hypothetical protein
VKCKFGIVRIDLAEIRIDQRLEIEDEISLDRSDSFGLDVQIRKIQI